MLSEEVSEVSDAGGKQPGRRRGILIALASAAVVVAGIGFAVAGLARHLHWGDGDPVRWSYPAVAGYGGIVPLPNAAVQPDRNKIYRAVFVVSSDIRDPSRPDPALESVARAVNVFASAGVPLSHLRFVAVIYGDATPAVLDDVHYRAKYHVANPNVDLIMNLKKAGVAVEVCGQSLTGDHFRHAWVDKNVTISLSALSDLVIYGDHGYVVVKH